jgi:hypothetical protein
MNSGFSTEIFTALRIKDHGTYDGAALQVYIANATNDIDVYLVDQADTGSGWVVKDFVADASDPGDVDSYGSFTSKAHVDLTLVRAGGGIATTGNIIAENSADTSTSKHLQVAPDTDKGFATIGRAVMGKIGFDDYAGFKHFDSASQTAYALLQDSSGRTLINSASGQIITFRNNNTEVGRFSSSGFQVTGSLSKGSGSFKIDHPLESKKDTHHLVHSFIEGPQADLIYRGKVDLVDGKAVVNMDQIARMTEGTFEVLNRNIQCFTSNESDWDAVKGSVSGNKLTIECQNTNSTATISWTHPDGKIIMEPEK